MNITIHRGTHEIGGSCVEISSGESRIVIDIGMPLVQKSGERFEFRDYEKLTAQELVKEKILPDIKGIYKFDGNDKPVDGMLISHPHIDHYGFFRYLHDDIPYYLGEGTRKIIDLTGILLGLSGSIKSCRYLKSGSKIKIGNFTVTPFLMDHSAFDAYAFLIEIEGKKVIYSGDFREHGRKVKAFHYFLKNVPKDIDALLLEGTMIGHESKATKTEEDIEKEIVKVLNRTTTLVSGISTSQNIDRLVSFFKAALRTKRLFVIDVYTANVLSEIASPKIPHPSKEYPNIRVYFPHSICNRLEKSDRKDLMYKFTDFKITKEEISDNLGKVLMMIRMSMVSDLKRIKGIEKSTVIYSMWDGYLKEKSSKKFLEFVEEKEISFIKLHTSGHADIKTLQKVVNKIKPKMIIPIHTFSPEKYSEIFPGVNVFEASDGTGITI
ncbi:MAG: MBL fold metallo-hydrolase [Candidatus Schekmanbacteria bacterium]|nr:MBL fold metallo-hydrolase [Candidatus Schekmanbacteria bacterium]